MGSEMCIRDSLLPSQELIGSLYRVLLHGGPDLRGRGISNVLDVLSVVFEDDPVNYTNGCVVCAMHVGSRDCNGGRKMIAAIVESAPLNVLSGLDDMTSMTVLMYQERWSDVIALRDKVMTEVPSARTPAVQEYLLMGEVVALEKLGHDYVARSRYNDYVGKGLIRSPWFASWFRETPTTGTLVVE